ncbi:hypothetical protein QBC34DRAFT_65917 [Podospora aff. communis PSN243]|uniref:Uncharacterized protein n=1 Tax=Podospora aff. communis PSN243 TaxID=3040156 RepID=A0AAV9GRF3_9PEZI|nr:hypothetical protein QBC34DRAFT_65917 [Podospora aff. communis PSN243]
MAPSQQLPGFLNPREDDVTAPAATTLDGGVTAESSASATSNRPWMIPVIVVGILILTALAIWAFVIFNRRREYGKARAQEPYLSRPEFDKRRKMSQAEKLEEEEKQRIIMIRKSLASRSWDGSQADSAPSSRRVSQVSNQSQQHGTPTIPEAAEVSDEEEDTQPRPLKDDWKAYEAEVMRETSQERHPAADGDARPLLNPQAPDSPQR